uniref:Uncharacterized protein n=1 Tax=Vibrio sp. DAT722 TaxID=344879 RepID=Q2F9R8_9VIBR|nr:hypothetical protein [Vibrio sp. DAT722]
MALHTRSNGFYIVLIPILFKLFLNTPCTIALLIICKNFSNLAIKLFAALIALSNFVAMINPVIKPTSRNLKHLSHTDNPIPHQVFEHKLITIYFRFFAK